MGIPHLGTFPKDSICLVKEEYGIGILPRLKYSFKILLCLADVPPIKLRPGEIPAASVRS
jgi:hypothetical protein